MRICVTVIEWQMQGSVFWDCHHTLQGYRSRRSTSERLWRLYSTAILVGLRILNSQLIDT